MVTASPDNSQPSAESDARFRTSRVLTLSAGHAVHDTYTAFLPPLLPVFVERMSLSNAAAGLLSAFRQAPALLQPFVGHLADRRTLRYAVILAPAIAAVLMSLLGWAGSYAVLGLLLAAAGVNTATFHAVGPPMVGRMAGTRLGRGMAFWMVGGELGRTLGPLVVASALALLTLRGMAVVMVVGIAASWVMYRQLRDAPLRLPAVADRIPWRQGLRTMRRPMVLLSGLVLVRSLAMAAATTYLPIFLTSEGVGLWAAGAALSVLEVAGIGGALVGGWVSDRLGRRVVMVTAYATAPGLLIAFVMVSGWMRVPLLLLLGFALLAIQPVNMALAQEAAPESRALANGVYLSISFAGRSVAAVAFGVLADTYGLRTASVVAAVVMTAGVPLARLLPGRRGG
jgi:FSR family fosmidomycin resistance protein-like MFS transporter